MAEQQQSEQQDRAIAQERTVATREPSQLRGLGPDGRVSTIAHTPTPWVADFHNEQRDGGRFITYVRGGNQLVPIAAVPTGVEGYGREEGRANARLIAAAPALATSAARLLAVFDQQRMTTAERIIVGISDAGLRTEGNAAIEALRAALASAQAAK